MGDYEAILLAVEWADVGVAIVATAASIASVFVIIRGSRYVLDEIRGYSQDDIDGWADDHFAAENDWDVIEQRSYNDDGSYTGFDHNGDAFYHNPNAVADDREWDDEKGDFR